MGIYPFGYILIILICVTIIKNRQFDHLFKDFLILELVFGCSRMNYGYFIEIAGNEIDYNDILLGILFVLSVYALIGGYVNHKLFVISLTFLFIVGIGMFLCVIFPSHVEVMDYTHSWDTYFHGDRLQLTQVRYSSQSILMYFRLVIFVTVLNAVKVMFNYEDWLEIAAKVVKVLRIIIIYGVVEVVLKFGFNININNYLNILFGRGIVTGGGIDRLQGICREPSYYALGLLNFIIVSILFNKLKNKKRSIDIWIITAIIIGSISTSFSFFICLISIIILYILIFENEQNKVIRTNVVLSILMVLFIILIIVTNNYFLLFASSSSIPVLNRIAEAVWQMKKGFAGTYVLGRDYSSEASRLIGGILSLKAGISRPILGLGIGTVYCVTGLIAIFANIGILGLGIWIYMLFYVYGNKVNWMVVFTVLLPVVFCNDLYTLYDTSYVLLIPLVSYYFSNKIEVYNNE